MASITIPAELVEDAMPKSEYYIAIFFFILLFIAVIFVSFSAFTFYQDLADANKEGINKDYWITTIVFVALIFVIMVALIALHFSVSNKKTVKKDVGVKTMFDNKYNRGPKQYNPAYLENNTYSPPMVPRQQYSGTSGTSETRV